MLRPWRRWTAEEEATLLDMHNRGFGTKEIARVLGRGAASVYAKLPHNDAKKPRRSTRRERACMTCGTKFMSEGNHNRMCTRCRQNNSGDGVFSEQGIGNALDEFAG